MRPVVVGQVKRFLPRTIDEDQWECADRAIDLDLYRIWHDEGPDAARGETR